MHTYAPSASGLARLADRLATLSPHELQCLQLDAELQHQAALTQQLVEQRLAQLRLRLGQPLALFCEPLDLTGAQTRSESTSSAHSSALSEPSPSKLPAGAKKARLAEYQRACQLATTTKKAPKKYKGEFDEPNPHELELRQQQLVQLDSYHGKLGQLVDAEWGCTCVLGSRFESHSASQALEMVERWRALPTAQRIAHKWHVTDLPKDISLQDIKRFENLRRDLSQGRADFGGASKRKPLGIRGTRQFLLLLYCLWGHPGRNDRMQREGYCPHCFAKIKRANEQSTLVRLVNHFNMKHRQGSNPRLTPASQQSSSLLRAVHPTQTQ